MYCSRCGEKNEAGQRFCKKCGTLLFQLTPPTIHQGVPYPANGKKLPKEESPKPTVNPFGDPEADEDSPEVEQGSHWGARVVIALLLMAMFIVILTNVGDRVNGIDCIKMMYKDFGQMGGMDGEGLLHFVCTAIFYHGTLILGLMTLFGVLTSPFKRPVKMFLILLSSVAGIVAEAMIGTQAGNFIPAVTSAIISVLLLIVNGQLLYRESVEDGFNIPGEDAGENNPLL